MYSLYVNYFKWLCQLHPSIQHTDATPAFRVISVEEALGDLRGAVSQDGFMFRLIDYTWTVNEAGAFQFQAKQGGFIVAKMINPREDAETQKKTARDEVETIVNDFITHMLADSRAGHPLFSQGGDSLEDFNFRVQPLLPTGDGSYEGLIVTFDFLSGYEYELECHPIHSWRQLSPFSY